MKILVMITIFFVNVYSYGQTNFLNDSLLILGSEHSSIIRNIFPDLNEYDLRYKLVLYNNNSNILVKSIDGLGASDIDVSNKLKVISVLGSEVEKVPKGHKIKSGGHNGLIILSTELKILYSIDSVMAYTWNPAKDRIAYIKGYRLQEKPMFCPTGVYLLDVKSKRSKKIGDSGIDITWQEFDDNIYIQDWDGVFVYNTKSNILEKTQHKGIYFSKDGKHYFSRFYEGGGIEIFETQSNRKIDIDGIKTDRANFYQWLNKDELIIGDISLEKKVVNINTGIVKNKFTGKMIGYNLKTLEIIVYKDKKMFKELSESKIEKIKIK